MEFNEAEQRRVQFSTRLRSGQLTPAQFAQAMTGLQVTDTRGTIWQPNPSGDGWIFWTGSAWQPGAPPGMPGGPGMAAGTGVPQKSAKDFNEFKSSLMTVDEFKKVSKDVPLAQRPQRWWDLLSILGGVVAAILWFLYGGIRSGREGFDFITPLLMIAIPVILVWFRTDIDQILLPLQFLRRKISKILLIGLGFAIPFLTAWLLYNFFNISEYPLMQANIIVGTFAAYVITRDPQVGPGRQTSRGPVAGMAMIIFMIMICSCLVAPVMADDCARDPLNARDCLRTDGFAEVMAGLIATILASLVNGPIILQTLLQGPSYAPPSAPGTTPGVSGSVTGATTSVAGTIPSTTTPEQFAQSFISSQQYAPGYWHISRDSTGNATGVYLDVEFWNPSGASTTSVTPTRFTTTHIPLQDLQSDQLFSTPVDVSRQQPIASQSAQSLTTEDVRILANNPLYNGLSDPEKRNLIQRLANGIKNSMGLTSLPVTYSTTQPHHAQYNPANNSIEINPTIPGTFDNNKNIIETIAHEAEHAAQHQNKVTGPSAPGIQYNNSNYITPETDPSRYVSQIKERDSISFGIELRRAIAERRRSDRAGGVTR